MQTNAKIAAGHEGLSHESDAALVDLARQGSEAAVRAIIARHNQRLFRVARAVLRDDIEAEDAVQETYLRAFANLSSFRGDALLSTWLTRIALNESLGRVGKRRPTADISVIDERRDATIVMFPNSPPANPEAEAGRSQVRALLERAIDRLPDGFRAVFMLREIEEMSVQETADFLGLEAGTVKTRLHRARKLMRADMERQLASAFTDLYPFKGRRCAALAERVIQAMRRHDGETK